MLLRLSVIVLAVYGGLLYLTYFGFTHVPTGFIPPQDKGYLLVDVRLPDSASLERTQEVMTQIEQIALGERVDAQSDARCGQGGIPGIAHTIAISGQSIVQNAIGSNYGSIYVILDEFHHRHGADLGADAIAAKLRAACYRDVQEASVAVFGAPAVDGLGNAGGFKVMVRDVGDLGFDALQEAADDLAASGNEQPGLVGLFSAFRSQTPQMYVDIDRERCKAMGVPLERSVSHAAALSGWLLHQRLQPVRPHLAGQFAGRSRRSLDPRAGAATESPQCRRRNGAAGQRRGNQTRRRPGARDSLQRRDRGRRQRRIAARRQLRHRHQDGR